MNGSKTVPTTKPDWGIGTTWQVIAIATSHGRLFSSHFSSSPHGLNRPLARLAKSTLALVRIDGGFRHPESPRSTTRTQWLVRISMAAPRPTAGLRLLWRSLFSVVYCESQEQTCREHLFGQSKGEAWRWLMEQCVLEREETGFGGLTSQEPI